MLILLQMIESIDMTLVSYLFLFISSICLVHMNVCAKFDEIPSMILEVIKETKHYGHTDGRSDNVKTVPCN